MSVEGKQNQPTAVPPTEVSRVSAAGARWSPWTGAHREKGPEASRSDGPGPAVATSACVTGALKPTLAHKATGTSTSPLKPRCRFAPALTLRFPRMAKTSVGIYPWSRDTEKSRLLRAVDVWGCCSEARGGVLGVTQRKRRVAASPGRGKRPPPGQELARPGHGWLLARCRGGNSYRSTS